MSVFRSISDQLLKITSRSGKLPDFSGGGSFGRSGGLLKLEKVVIKGDDDISSAFVDFEPPLGLVACKIS